MRNKVRFLVLVVGLVIGWNCMAGSLGATVYRYQDLTLQGFPSGVGISAINDAGQIVGNTTTTQAYFWDAVKGLTLLQSLGGASSQAYGINKQGQIVGEAQTGTAVWHACLWTDPSQAPTNLGVGVAATAINDNGLIIGNSHLQGFKWTTPGPWVALGTEGDFAEDLNNAGQIVGCKKNDQLIEQGCIWEPDGSVTFLADATYALFINNQGNVVGIGPNGLGGLTNFYWDHQTGNQLIIGIATHAQSFNDDNQAIAFDSLFGFDRYLWSPTQMLWVEDITKLVVNLPQGVTITKISHLSPKGSILGTDSQGHLCLLTPIPALPGLSLLLMN
jgi:probable HAF family extracellular repeat protein